ncbi:tail fiber protein [Rhodopseudomonas sp. P2A-2r]|uniref:tail fiber protein n=1 Tax=Rhodopseudomonas sp. P2A-2r TaxID=2991972 RepID=UPI002233E928|nr:tail fiber protein [Rhodopseudomonas sp. P2A-2r]UZE51920.1 tail fiber protein [Rhodopseudomonas sp. P2A-2r]
MNDSARGAMAALAAYRDDISGATVTAGTNVAYTVATFSGFDTLAHLDKQVVAFTPHTTNGAGPVVLNVDSTGSRPLRTSPGIELLQGTIIQGTPYLAVLNNTDGSYYLQGFYGSAYNVPLGGMLETTDSVVPNSSFVAPVGQAISRTTYATYFARVGTNFGAGDGATTFNVIDMRGCVGVVTDGGAGRMPGVGLNSAGGVAGASQALALSQIPNYAPPFSGNSVTPTGAVSSGVIYGGAIIGVPTGSGAFTSTNFGAINVNINPITPSGTVGSINGGQGQVAINTAMPYRGVNKILRII